MLNAEIPGMRAESQNHLLKLPYCHSRKFNNLQINRKKWFDVIQFVLVVSIVAIFIFFMPFWYRPVYLVQCYILTLSLPPPRFEHPNHLYFVQSSRKERRDCVKFIAPPK